MWDKELSAGLGTPSKIYSSPLSRALRTCFISFDALLEDDSKVLIVEVSDISVVRWCFPIDTCVRIAGKSMAFILAISEGPLRLSGKTFPTTRWKTVLAKKTVCGCPMFVKRKKKSRYVEAECWTESSMRIHRTMVYFIGTFL